MKKVQPHSVEAEKQVLGSILLNEHNIKEILGMIDTNDFYLQKHKIIFSLMKLRYKCKMPIDIGLLIIDLKEIPVLEVIGGEKYLYELANECSATKNYMAYSMVIRERSVLRELIKLADEIQQGCISNKSVLNIIDEAELKAKKLQEKLIDALN